MAINILWGEVTVGFEQKLSMWGEDSSLKTRVVTHPNASDTGRCLTAAISD